MKIRPLEAQVFHAHERTDGHTGITKLIVAIRNLRTRLKSVYHMICGEFKNNHRRNRW